MNCKNSKTSDPLRLLINLTIDRKILYMEKYKKVLLILQ